jgi:hypothetical protein
VADREIRVEIGFEGGLIVSMRIDDAEWSKLEAGLASGEHSGLIAVAGEAGTTYHVDPRRVCYVRRERQASRVGF